MSDVTASATQETREQVAELCRKNRIHTVECMVVDTWGIPRGKRVPVDHFLAGGGFNLANVIYIWDPRCGIQSSPWVSESDGYPDMHLQPDLESFHVASWAEGLGVVMCDAVDERTHEPVALDSRAMLKRTLGQFAERGWYVDSAAELEFYLTTPDGAPAFDDVHCYSLTKGAVYEPVLAEVRIAMETLGISVEACNLEYGPAQVEINLRYGPAMYTADATVLFKYVTRLIARRHGYDITFMAKPFTGQSGSGMHVHQSLTDEHGTNLFATDDQDGPISNNLMQRYLSGLMAHHRELQAVMMPTINGYKRLEDYSFAPTQVTWGLDNRLVGVRCIVGAGKANRLEARWAAADSNPYLVLTGCLQAGLHGLTEDLPLQPMVTGDPHAEDHWERLPSSLGDAIQQFTDSSFTKQAFGERFVECFSVMQHHELAAFTAHVTDWERTRYRDVI